MGRQSIKSKVIIRAGTKSAAGSSDGNREFLSVFETVNAAGRVIPPFIVWTGNVHTESYYPKYANPRDCRNWTALHTPIQQQSSTISELFIRTVYFLKLPSAYSPMKCWITEKLWY